MRECLRLVVAQAAAMDDVGDGNKRRRNACGFDAFTDLLAQAADVTQAETEG